MATVIWVYPRKQSSGGSVYAISVTDVLRPQWGKVNARYQWIVSSKWKLRKTVITNSSWLEGRQWDFTEYLLSSRLFTDVLIETMQKRNTLREIHAFSHFFLLSSPWSILYAEGWQSMTLGSDLTCHLHLVNKVWFFFLAHSHTYVVTHCLGLHSKLQ